MSQYTEVQLDALRELANIGSGTASTALSGMLGRSVDVSVPNAQALPFALSALGEIGHIVGTSYINALASMTGMEIEPTPPATATDMLGAIVETVLAGAAITGDVALLLDSSLVVEGEGCSIGFLLVPDQGGVELLLERLGLS